MADIELVIKVPEEYLEVIKSISDNQCTGDMLIIKNGTPLPKGHGRLKDIDKIEWYGCTTAEGCPYKDLKCKDCNRAECDKSQVDNIPTIIEADVKESGV